MSRNLLPIRSPEGIDDQTWFLLNETLGKLDTAATSIASRVSTVEAGGATPNPVVAFTDMPFTRRLLSTQAFQMLQWGPISSHWQLSDTNYPWSSSTSQRRLNGNYYDVVGEYVAGTHASGSGTGLSFLTAYAAIPAGFTGWETEAMRFSYSFNQTGVAAGSTCVVTLQVKNPYGTTTLASTTNTHAVSGTTISAAYPQTISLSASDLGTSWERGVPVLLQLIFTAPINHTGATFGLGRLDVNWR